MAKNMKIPKGGTLAMYDPREKRNGKRVRFSKVWTGLIGSSLARGLKLTNTPYRLVYLTGTEMKGGLGTQKSRKRKSFGPRIQGREVTLPSEKFS